MKYRNLKKSIAAAVVGATMLFGVGTQAFAVGSITAVISAPAAEAVSKVTLADGTTVNGSDVQLVVEPVKVTAADIAAITSNEAVAELVTAMDSTDTGKSVQGILDAIAAKLGTETLKVTFGDTEDQKSYDLTKAVGLSNFAVVSFQKDGETLTGIDKANVKLEIPNVKGMDEKKAATIRDMCVNVETGAIAIVKPTKVDTKTGEITIDLTNFDTTSGKILTKVIYQP